MSLTAEQAQVFLDNGEDVVLRMEIGIYIPADFLINDAVKMSEPLHLSIIFKASDYDEDTFDEKLDRLVHGKENWSLRKDTGEGLECLRESID